MLKDHGPTTISLPASKGRGYGRGAQVTVSLNGLVNATRPTLAEARAALAENVLEYVSHALDAPAFARNDDGALIVALPRGSGTEVFRVDEIGARSISYCEGSPRDALERVWHYTLI